MHLNPDITLQDIEMLNPEKMTIEELRETRNKIYQIPDLEFIKPEGIPVANYLVRVNEQLAKLTMRNYRNPIDH